jgi:hypothetical protein
MKHSVLSPDDNPTLKRPPVPQSVVQFQSRNLGFRMLAAILIRRWVALDRFALGSVMGNVPPLTLL